MSSRRALRLVSSSQKAGLNSTFAHKKPSGQVRLAAAERLFSEKAHMSTCAALDATAPSCLQWFVSDMFKLCICQAFFPVVTFWLQPHFLKSKTRKPNPYTKQSRIPLYMKIHRGECTKISDFCPTVVIL